MEKIKKFWKGLKKEHKLIALIIVLILIILLILGFVFSNDGEVVSKCESTLKEIKEITEFQSVIYDYNGVAVSYKDSKKKDIKYYVAYKGTVSAGFDFTKLKMEVDEFDEKIIITLPEMVIQDVTIDNSSLDFIFEKKKYNTEDVVLDARKLCKEDLENNAKKEGLVLDTARESAISAIKGMFQPWIEASDLNYEVIVR